MYLHPRPQEENTYGKDYELTLEGWRARVSGRRCSGGCGPTRKVWSVVQLDGYIVLLVISHCMENTLVICRAHYQSIWHRILSNLTYKY